MSEFDRRLLRGRAAKLLVKDGWSLEEISLALGRSPLAIEQSISAVDRQTCHYDHAEQVKRFACLPTSEAPIKIFGKFSVRTSRILKEQNISTFGELEQAFPALMTVRGFGERSRKEVEEELRQTDLSAPLSTQKHLFWEW